MGCFKCGGAMVEQARAARVLVGRTWRTAEERASVCQRCGEAVWTVAALDRVSLKVARELAALPKLTKAELRFVVTQLGEAGAISKRLGVPADQVRGWLKGSRTASASMLASIATGLAERMAPPARAR